ncbi:MFS transporter [Sphingomonas colocasiae]|uniref:MFS transporter n=1 Tax=Sphingomonas colocasiae TaxID=1848973 RepID=A0ABS7PZT5_9SPHN|nr:MFS transporter [Sphingomonas colocasiae]MBY8825509.1 MFS transporter [Sphingomonas colocasiae]
MTTNVDQPRPASGAYKAYVLFILMLVYVFNLLDRQILSILAESIKHDLGISDSEIGFLLGISFAVFYAVFGIPLGKAADIVNRTRLVSIGLAAWSVMTALSGAARSFGFLAMCRMGVGVGEASASPAVYSLLCDYFPKHQRTTAIAIYTSGLFIGAGLGLTLGGWVLSAWTSAYPDPALAPLQLKAWQAAFVIVGCPGLLLALFVAALREPIRGALDGQTIAPERRPMRAIAIETLTMLPATGAMVLYRVAGRRALLTNLAIALTTALGGALVGRLTGDHLQWGVLAFGLYAVCTWTQKFRAVDPDGFKSIFGNRSLLLGFGGFAGCCFLTIGPLAWLAVYFQRTLGATPSDVGLMLGLSYAVAGFSGITLGAMLTDRLILSHGERVRLVFSAAAISCASAALIACLLTASTSVAYAWTVPFNFFSAMWLAPAAANVSSQVPPNIRATASAIYIVTQVFLGTAMAPFVVGALSDQLMVWGVSAEQSVQQALLLSQLALIPAVICLVWGWRRMKA